MKKIFAVALFGLIVLSQANLGYGAGFLIYEHGAAAMAMAGAWVSVADNPSAIWHNPAGIAFLKGTQVSVGTTLIWSRANLELTNWPLAQAISAQRNWDQISQTFYPSNVYLTQSLGDRITLGFGFFSPFGLGAKWSEEPLTGGLPSTEKFPFRYLGYEDDMKTFFFNPVVGFKLSDQFSVGVGVSYVYSTVMFRTVEYRDFGPYGAYDVPAEMNGNGDAWNFNAGLLYRGEKFGFGLNYRSAFSIKYSGDLDLNISGLPTYLQPYVPTKAKGETTFKFPGIFSFGFSVNFTEKFLLSADANYVIWSRFDKYVVTFDNPLIEPMSVDENFKDSWTFRLGAQYKATEKFALRGGFLYDWTPQPVETMDPLLPDSDRYAFTFGIGYTIGKFILDVTYHHELFSDRTAPNRYIPSYQVGPINLGESTYKMTADLLGISLSFVF